MSKLKNHSSPWIQITILLAIISLSLSPLCCAVKHHKGGGDDDDDDDDNGVSYSTHCNSIPPKSTAQQERKQVLVFPRYPSTNVSGGAPFLNYSSAMSKITVVFCEFRAYETVRDDVLKVEVTLILRQTVYDAFYYGYGIKGSPSDYHSKLSSRRSRRGVLSFKLNGYMYQDTGVLCMVGHGNGFSRKGGILRDIPAVFRVDNLKKKSSIDTSLITATLESVSLVHDSGYFKQISLLMFNVIGYEYSLVLKERDNGGFDRIDDGSKSLPLPSQPVDTFCSIFCSNSQFELVYPGGCDSDKNCSPFEKLVFTSMLCDNEDHKLRVLVKFLRTYDYDYSTSFDPETALIGEGVWDGKKNQLHIVACKILGSIGSLKDARVGDCLVRLSLRFPATASIRDSSYIKGNIWSRKPINDSEYFNEIEFKAARNRGASIGGLKYEYTLLDKVSKYCTPPRITNKSMEDRYPDAASDELKFGYLVNNPYSISSGYSMPVFVGYLEQNGYAIYATPPSGETLTPSYPVEKNLTLQVPVNVSYAINFQETLYMGLYGDQSTYRQTRDTQISAEGIYDPRTGGLCMIGCKKLGPEIQVTAERGLDCEIVINFQFPSLNSKSSDIGCIAGSIESTRNTNDSLYFERLELTSSACISSVMRENISRMDFKIILVLISNTLAYVFVAFQLFYVERRPQRLSFASLIMLAILTLSYMIRLPNHDSQNVSLRSGRWIDMNEVQVRVITTVAFLLEIRLLKLAYSSRVSGKMNVWAPEIKGLVYVLLPINIVGALVTCVLNWIKDDQQRHLLGDLKSYAGLVFDGFLLPQILLNIFSNTKEKTLSVAYYAGSTFLRLLPRAYDLFRSNGYQSAGEFESLYTDYNHGTVVNVSYFIHQISLNRDANHVTIDELKITHRLYKA